MKQSIIAGVILAGAALITYGIFSSGARPQEANALDGFAQCLADSGFTMYGAYWCPHCQNEKAAFGDSFERIPYVECTKEPNRCTAAGIKGFPTWVTSDGRRFEGEQGVERLAEASGCSLPSVQEPLSDNP